jgi:cupin
MRIAVLTQALENRTHCQLAGQLLLVIASQRRSLISMNPVFKSPEASFNSGTDTNGIASNVLDMGEFDYACITAGKPWQLELSCRKPFGVTFIALIQGAAILSLKGQRRSSPIFAGDVCIAFGQHQFSLGGMCQSEPAQLFKLEERKLRKLMVIGGRSSPSTFVIAFLTFDRSGGSPVFFALPRILWMRPDLNRSRGFQAALDLLTQETIRPSIWSRLKVFSICSFLLFEAIDAHMRLNNEPAKLVF